MVIAFYQRNDTVDEIAVITDSICYITRPKDALNEYEEHLWPVRQWQIANTVLGAMGHEHLHTAMLKSGWKEVS